MFARRNGVRRPDGLEAGVLLAMTPLISPQGWDYVLVLATPMLVFLANDIDRLSRPLRLLAYAGIAAVGLTLFDLLGRRLLYALLEWSVVTLGMLALVATAVAVRMRKLA
jgi:purine-cytosine permease-like protein